MGHSTAQAYVAKGNSGQRFDTREILLQAGSAWRDEDGYGDPSIGWCSFYEHPILVTQAQANTLIDSGWNGGDKKFNVNSDNGVIFRIAAETDIVTTTKRVKVTLTAEEVRKVRMNSNDYSKLVKLVEGKVEGFVEKVRVAKLPAPRKPVASTTEGKTVTVYKVAVVTSSSWNGFYEEHVDVDKVEYASQAEARAEALKVAERKSTAGKAFERIEVHPFARRDTGSKAVVVVSQEDKGGVVELECTVTNVKKNAVNHGWLVFFDVHH